MDGSGAGPDGEDTSEERYRMAPGARRSAAYTGVEPIAAAWRLALEAVTAGASLSVRVVGGDVPMVRAECCVPGAVALAELLCKVPDDGAGLLLPASGVRRVRGEVMDGAARLNPGWYAVIPNTDYVDAARSAYAMADELELIFNRLLPGGAVEVAPAWWQSGDGWVRFDLEPEHAAWLTALVRVLLGGEDRQGG